MNCKKILFDYVVQNEGYTSFPQLEQAEEKLLDSLSDKQKTLFENYVSEYSKTYSNRMYYYFCKGIKVRL